MSTQDKAKLALEMLELEMEVLTREEQMFYMGGSSGSGGISSSGGSTGVVTAYLSIFFGVTVTSGTDAQGNWTISIGGGAPIPLTFQLDEVNCTSQGISYGGYSASTWGDFFGGSSTYFDFSSYSTNNFYSSPMEPGNITASNNLINFIKGAEGFSAFAYDDGFGNLTVGWGHVVTEAEKMAGTFLGRIITPEEAENILRNDLATAVSSVNRNIHQPMTQNQFDAFVSYAYQQGSTNFANSDANTYFNQGNIAASADALRHASDASADGRVHRRGEEADLFISGDYNFAPY